MIKKILLTAGGTGGHIWPAVSFGRWLNANVPSIEIEYVCGSRPLEREIYSAASVEPNILPVDGSPLSGRILKQFFRMADQVVAVRKSLKLLSACRPDAVLLFGGYVSLPMLVACCIKGVSIFCHEQNAYAGRVTRIAAKLGAVVFTGWAECIPLLAGSFQRVGVPIRNFVLPERREAWRSLGLPGDAPSGGIAVIMTGSLGSSIIKDVICSAAARSDFLKRTFLLPAQSDKIEQAAANVILLPRVWDTALLFALADAAIVRGGGSTLTEIASLRIPALVIPWRRATDDHQKKNALAFLSENKGYIWDESSGKDSFAEKLDELFENMGKDGQRNRSGMYNNADRICEILWKGLLKDSQGGA